MWGCRGISDGELRGLTCWRKCHSAGTLSRPLLCSTTCRRYSAFSLFLQCHILEQCSPLSCGSCGRKAAGSASTILATGLEPMRSSSLMSWLRVRSDWSRCWKGDVVAVRCPARPQCH